MVGPPRGTLPGARPQRGVPAPPVVVHQDDHVLVVLKPAGVPTTSPDGRSCLTAAVRLLDPRAPVCHPTSRLDRDVTGLVTFARTSRGIERLLAARRTGRYGRTYVALVVPREGAHLDDEARFAWAIALDPRDATLRVALDAEAAKAAPRASRVQHAETHARVEVRRGPGCLVALSPRTGRTHQLRVHCARAGAPIAGDVDYGGPPRLVQPDGRVIAFPRPLLHCARLDLPLGPGGATITLRAPPPDDLRAALVGLGGGDGNLAFLAADPPAR